MKKCYKCQVLKDRAGFARNIYQNDGLQTLCRECKKVLDHLYYQSHSPQMRKQINEAKRKRVHKVQDRLHTYLSSHPCVDCGEKNIIVLEFDHVKGNKKGNISYMASTAKCSWKTILEEIEKCEVRCANCHRIKTAGQRNWYKLLVP